ncbi:MAG: ACT domain-containing protein [Clostridia bacterium]|nr:ACT domain-containing protein [Clostridia bacterium]
MTIKQLSIFVENKSGSLARIIDILAANEIDLRALSISETQDFGILRLIVNDTFKAAQVLRNENCVVSITDVYAIAVPDQPGGLAKVLRLLADAQVSVEYTYAFISNNRDYAYIAIRTAEKDVQTAKNIFMTNGTKVISEDDLLNL